MMEPVLVNPVGEDVPYSLVPSDVLSRYDTLLSKCGYTEEDIDFNKRYAAILLRERGA